MPFMPGEIDVGKGNVLDGAFFEAHDRAAGIEVRARDVVDVDITEERGALREGFRRGFRIVHRENDGGADVVEVEVGGNDVFDDAATATGAFDADAGVGAVAVAVEEADMADAAGGFAADGADAVGRATWQRM